MSTATWIRNELEQRGVYFEELHHPEVFTAQAVAQCEHVSGHRVAKVIGVIADGEALELILPASRRIDLERLRDLLGTRGVRLASEDEIANRFTDCERGAIPALRHWQDVGVWMDASLVNAGDIIFQAGTHCDAIRMHFDDWFRMVQPRVAAFTAPLRPQDLE
jgi:Ala-tRNA(Pro) deacylase